MGSIFDKLLPEEKFEDNYDPTVGGGPVPEGRYEAELSFANNEVPYDSVEQWRGFGSNPTHYGTNLVATLTGPNGVAGRRVFTYFSTAPYLPAGKGSDKRTSTAARVVRALDGKEAVAEETVVGLMQAFVRSVGENRKAIVDVQWNTGACKSCKDRGVKWTTTSPTGVRGMQNFPQDAKGNHLPEVKCPTCGSELRANTEFTVRASI